MGSNENENTELVQEVRNKINPARLGTEYKYNGKRLLDAAFFIEKKTKTVQIRNFENRIRKIKFQQNEDTDKRCYNN